jgi:hypothetical protein
MPSFDSSAWIFRARQRFSVAIRMDSGGARAALVRKLELDRVLVGGKALVGAQPRILRQYVVAVPHRDGMNEVLVQMIGKLDDAIFQTAADVDVVEDREVLHVLAQTDAARVWADGNVEVGRQQQRCDDLVDPSQSAAIDLQEIGVFAPAISSPPSSVER